MPISEELLEQLHKLTAEELINRIVSGEATAGELGVAVRFLKDNGIDVSEKAESPMLGLASVVPFKPEVDDQTEAC